MQKIKYLVISIILFLISGCLLDLSSQETQQYDTIMIKEKQFYGHSLSYQGLGFGDYNVIGLAPGNFLGFLSSLNNYQYSYFITDRISLLVGFANLSAHIWENGAPQIDNEDFNYSYQKLEMNPLKIGVRFMLSRAKTTINVYFKGGIEINYYNAIHIRQQMDEGQWFINYNERLKGVGYGCFIGGEIHTGRFLYDHVSMYLGVEYSYLFLGETGTESAIFGMFWTPLGINILI